MIVDVDTIVGFWPARRCDISVERLQLLMQRHGVEQAWVCSARGLWYDDEEGNRETAEVAQRYANLVPVATLNPLKLTNAAAEIKRWMDGGGRIFRFFPEYQGWPLNSPSWHRILAMLDEARAVIVVGGSVSPVLPEIRGLHTPVILAGAHVYQLADALALADEMPNVYLSTRLLLGPGSVEVAVSHLGAERLVFGSHAPVVYQESALRVVQAADLNAEQRQAILQGNAQRLIGGGV